MKQFTEQLSNIELIMRIQKTNRKLLSIKEASIYYNIPENTINNWKYKKYIPFFNVDQEDKIHIDVFDAWLLGKFSWSNLSNIEEQLNQTDNEIQQLNKNIRNIEIPKPINYSWAFFGIYLYLCAISLYLLNN